ncbi:helix-turn-helix domain-containing protein [Flavobacteriales bacterium]|nr:helix-turn-helix domain-containing protein [Flavobacteriales bacterium]
MNKDDLITKSDLEDFKKEILEQLTAKIGYSQNKQWLRSSEVKKMLNISSGTLQNMRVNGVIPFSKIGRIYFYSISDILNVLETSKEQN